MFQSAVWHLPLLYFKNTRTGSLTLVCNLSTGSDCGLDWNLMFLSFNGLGKNSFVYAISLLLVNLGLNVLLPVYFSNNNLPTFPGANMPRGSHRS